MTTRPRPSFRNPPLTEVVCGLQFRPLQQFQAAHYGLFWKSVQKEYPTSRTVTPLNTPTLVPQPADGVAEVTLDLTLALPRVWFVSKDDTCLIQVQQDRFLFNWRSRQGNKYPRYPTVVRKFKGLFAKFERFLRDNRLGELALIGSEMTYVNVIQSGAIWQKPEHVWEVFPDFSWRRGSRFLPPPASFNFRSNHETDAGRLSVGIATARHKDGTQGVRFELTARGGPSHLEQGRIWSWFDQANTLIVDAFIDLTSKHMQVDEWQRTK